MVLAINEQFTTLLLVTDENNNPATGKTISYRIFDETRTVFATGSMTEIGSYGIYYLSWTPDAEGYWIFEAYYSGSDFHFYDIKMYQVGKGIEDDVYDRIGAPNFTTVVGDIANLITRTKGLDDIYDDIVTHITALATHDVDIKAELGHGTYGLSALDIDLTTIINKVTNLPTNPADASEIAEDFDRHLTSLDFWGDPEDIITISTSAGVKTLPNIVIPTLPAGATIWKVQLIGFISNIVDTSGSDNAINGSVNIQVKLTSTGTWRNAYDIQNNAFFVDTDKSPSRGGVPILGNLNNDDLGPNGYNEVTGAGTYEVQISSVASDGDNLVLYDLQLGLRVWIY